MEKPSWVCTLVTQALLCFALYLAFKVGYTEKFASYNTSRRPLDLHFLSVRGGFRPLKQQSHLLEQMEKVAKTFKAEFVVNISELGEDDPLMQNGTTYFPLLKVPWYNTRSSEGQGRECFRKQIKLPQGQVLEIIGLDTGLLQEHGNVIGEDQLLWLTRILEMSDSDWRIVIGFHPLIICKEQKDQMETTQVFEQLHHIFVKSGVNAYFSLQGCTDHYSVKETIAYIGNLGPSDIESHLNGRSELTEEMQSGFLLHRVGAFEIVSYFINPCSKLTYKSTLHQRGKEVM